MRKLTLALLLCSAVAHAQNVGINATGAAPAASAMLDVSSGTTGILVPRVLLTSIVVAAPIVAPDNSLLVFNTNSTVGVNGVSPGYYYWNTATLRWIRFAASTDAWATLGNAGTVAATNFLGTTDNVDMVVRTNNIERIRVRNNGFVGINQPFPALAQLEVASGSFDAINGHSNNVGGYLGRETNISFGAPAQTLLGSGVYASNPAAGYTSIFAQSTNAATVAAAITFSDVWIASYNYVQNGTATYNPPSLYGQLNVTNAALGGDQIAIRGVNMRGTTAGNPGYTIGVSGTADTQTQDAFGTEGVAFSNSPTKAGGYFESLTYPGVPQAYAYVGTTVGGIARKITGTAGVSEIIPTADHGRILLTCPESPEYWYQDYGTVQLVNGRAHVALDPILADIIMVTEDYPVRVFCTPVDMLEFNGITMTNRSPSGFDLVELNGGTHTGTVEYQLVVKPKTGFGEGRFPQAPGPRWLKADQEPAMAKAKNQVVPGSIFYWPSDQEVYGIDPARLTAVGSIVPAGEHHGKYKVAEGVYHPGMPAQIPKP